MEPERYLEWRDRVAAAWRDVILSPRRFPPSAPTFGRGGRNRDGAPECLAPVGFRTHPRQWGFFCLAAARRAVRAADVHDRSGLAAFLNAYERTLSPLEHGLAPRDQLEAARVGAYAAVAGVLADRPDAHALTRQLRHLVSRVSAGEPDYYAEDVAEVAVQAILAHERRLSRVRAVALAAPWAARMGRLLASLLYRPKCAAVRPDEPDPSQLKAWREGSPGLLAQAIHAGRTFDTLPVLADALEEAGCDWPDVLAHCRALDTETDRGDWVVELVRPHLTAPEFRPLFPRRDDA